MVAAPLEVGARAPTFTLDDQNGASISLADYRGSTVIVYFYADAGTPACTMQACDFRDNMRVLTAAGCTVLGISKDTVDDLAAFATAERVNFPLLSDPTLRVHKAYDAYGAKSLYGRPYVGTRRSTFIVDARGILRFAAYNVKAVGHAARVLKFLKIDAQLQ
jgi:thioredoxin-dependent peroxiredoxin